jgi:hypothetical protein
LLEGHRLDPRDHERRRGFGERDLQVDARRGLLPRELRERKREEGSSAGGDGDRRVLAAVRGEAREREVVRPDRDLAAGARVGASGGAGDDDGPVARDRNRSGLIVGAVREVREDDAAALEVQTGAMERTGTSGMMRLL